MEERREKNEKNTTKLKQNQPIKNNNGMISERERERERKESGNVNLESTRC